VAVNLPIITEFNGQGINKAIAEFKKLETNTEKAAFVMKKAFVPAVAAIGGLAAALGSATSAAMEDAAAQSQLALTLRNVTGASQAQVDAVEKQISAMTMATGIADDQLRPAFEALTRGTKDISVSMRDMTLVTDIATATNKPLVEVADALAKAYQGNFRGLQQLSPEMKTLIKDGADMETIMAVLTGTFGGATKVFAETAEGGMRRLTNSLNEAKEAVGAALLPVVEKALPYLNRFAKWAADNPKVFLAIAGTIGAIAAAIVAVNIAMAMNPFTWIAAGIAALVAGLVIAYNKFEWFRKGINFILNSIIGAVEGLVNGAILGINGLVTALNLIPGINIGTIDRISLPRIGGAGGQGFGDLVTENRGSMPTGIQAPPIPNLTPTGGGGGGGGGGRAVSTAVSRALPAMSSNLPDNVISELEAVEAKREARSITVNVEGGFGTSAEIGAAVVDALRQYNNVNGPAPIAIAAL
jgi:hypothetical protein